MAKKRGSSGGFGFLGCLLIFALLAFGGIFAGFYVLQNGNPFVSSLDSEPIGVEQMNPDVTQIPMTNAPLTPDTHPNSDTFANIMENLNTIRQDAGLNPVTLNTLLNNAAAEQAVYTASINDAQHEDANGDLADVRITAQGYEWASVGENLLSNWSLDGDEVFTLWRNSPSHHANMINPNFTEVGLAYMVTPIGQVYHAMVLARPQ